MAYEQELRKVHGDNLIVFFSGENSSLNVPEFIKSVPEDTELYMCGPIRLMDQVRREWEKSTHPFTNLRFETFGASGWFEPEEFIVRIPEKGVEVIVDKSHSMLEALENAGVEMLSDCRKGECGLCEVRVITLEGNVDHRDVFYSEKQKEENTKIACCVSRIVSESPTEQGKIPYVEIITT
jgi:vanillate O-demethylase ferredoxin subunit